MSSSEKVRIGPADLVGFYDTAPRVTGGAANAINAVAGEELGAGLLKHYLENSKGASVTILQEHPISPAQAQTGKRYWLDRWILAEWPNRKVLFQMEIKNWSAHSLDGKELPISATLEELKAYRIESWKREWYEGLRKPPTQKVLMQMKRPKGYDYATVEPLLGMWAVMHPAGDSEPFFEVKLPATHHFENLSVFSMSAYLRTLIPACDHVDLEMPRTIERLNLLNKLFVSA